MALATCKECGQPVAKSAPTCPHCGKKWPAGQPILNLDAGENLKSCGCCLMVLIALFLILGSLGVLPFFLI